MSLPGWLPGQVRLPRGLSAAGSEEEGKAGPLGVLLCGKCRAGGFTHVASLRQQCGPAGQVSRAVRTSQTRRPRLGEVSRLIEGTALPTFHATCPKPGVGAEVWRGSGGELLRGLLPLASKVGSPRGSLRRSAHSRSVDQTLTSEPPTLPLGQRGPKSLSCPH